MMNLTVGQRVIWLYTPRGGYGYTTRVLARVMRVGPKRITIEVVRIGRDGLYYPETRCVMADKLVERSTSELQKAQP